MSRWLAFPIVAAALLPWLHEPSGASGYYKYLEAYASCDDSVRISFYWRYSEDPYDPDKIPEWVGYDVYRRPMMPCGEYVRVNDEPFPRPPGSHNLEYTEIPPNSREQYQYLVVPIGTNRQWVNIMCNQCVFSGWASCPMYSAPVTHGILEDWGIALHLRPCPGSCYPSGYFTGPYEDLLRPLVGTGTAVQLFGGVYCGTTEGCAIQVENYLITPCVGVTPVARSSWGQLKLHYR